MGKYRTIFLFTIRKSKHSSKIKLFLLKIRVQTIAANFFLIQICICTIRNRCDLRIIRNISHNRKYLSGQHHAYISIYDTFHLSAGIIIITIEPSMPVSIRYPFIFLYKFCVPVCFFTQIFHKCCNIHRNLFSGNVMHAFICILCQNGIPLFSRCINIFFL